MGNAQTSKCTLTAAEIANCVSTSKFTADEVRALWFHFKTINHSTHSINRKYAADLSIFVPSSGLIVLFVERYRQFQSAMLFKDSALLDRIFRVFDADDDNEIIFSEYLSCMSSISSKATREEKLKCE
jgi:hypothetical protein